MAISFAAAFALLLSTATCTGGSLASVPDAETGPGDADAGSLTSHLNWVEACIAFTGCGLWTYGDHGGAMSLCVDSREFENEDCVRHAATNCDAVKTCLNGGDPNWACNPDAAPDHGCAGSSAWACMSSGNRVTTDCAQYGASCDIRLDGYCSRGACDPRVVRSCAANDLVECDSLGNGSGYSLLVEHCSEIAATCGAGVDAGATCVGTGAACTVNRCDGATLVQCVGGREGRTDCSALGFLCIPGDGDAADLWSGQASCGLGAECNPQFADSCNGTQLTYCDMGKLTTLDCVAKGWAKCSPGPPPFGGRCSL